MNTQIRTCPGHSLRTGHVDAVVVDWSTPPLRSGIAGLLDRAFGPGVTRGELLLQLLLPLLAALAVPLATSALNLPWSAVQQVVVAFLALDGLGGVITNSTSTAKRWFHRAGVGRAEHLAFIASHLLHFALVASVFEGAGLPWFISASAYLLAAAAVIITAPLHLQRPISAALVAVGIAYSLWVPPQVACLQWVLPVFYLKLLGAHLVREEPYRPGPSMRG